MVFTVGDHIEMAVGTLSGAEGDVKIEAEWLTTHQRLDLREYPVSNGFCR